VVVVVKQLSNPDSPFNPEYKKEKQFIRKENKKRIIIIIIVVFLVLYGSMEYLNKNITKIEIRTISGKKINSPININIESNLFIKNISPYNIKLIVSDGIETNYNNSILMVGIEYYFWFRTSPNSSSELQIRGVKT
jgi:hypothetical protein